jgi:NitT/TauT family transport system permease protein
VIGVFHRDAENPAATYPFHEKQMFFNQKTPVFNTNWLVAALQRTIVILFIMIVWEVLPALGLIDQFLLPRFSIVLKSLIGLVLSGEMFKHIMTSFKRSGLGFLLAVAFSIPVGVFMGWYKRVERIIDPLLQACRNTSTLALYPVFILFFGLGEASKISIIIWGTVWPVLLNTITGVKNIDPLLIKAARSMGVSKLKLFSKVVLPMASPSILTGLRLSAATAILMLVAAEMLGADRGLGFMIFYNQERYAIPEMFAGIITISILGVLINFFLVKLEKRLTRWKEKPVKT